MRSRSNTQRQMLFTMLAGIALFATTFSTSAIAKPEPPKQDQVVIELEQLRCGRCRAKLVNRLEALPGVVFVETDLPSATARVEWKRGRSVSPRQIWETVESTTLRPVRLALPDRVFRAKPRR